MSEARSNKDELRPKDIIYMEADDAIDDILELIKQTANGNVLLIPPKNFELLQSRVNMKFLVRTMQESKKNLILVTNNLGLRKLANSVGLPTAKTQASAERLLAGEELADEALTQDKDADVIDGEKLSNVLAEAGVAVSGDELGKKVAKKGAKKEEAEEEAEELGRDEGEKAGDKKKKVPNIKKLWIKVGIGVAALVLLIGLGVWMFVFAPAATVIVMARTSRNPFSQQVMLVTEQSQENLSNNVLFAERREIKKTSDVKFEATGEKNVGEKATGTMTLTRRYNSGQNLAWNGAVFAIEAGTVFADSTSGLKFVSTAPVNLAGCVNANMTNCGAPTVTVNVVAENSGANYNLAARAYTAGTGNTFSSAGSAMTGGTDRTVKIVTAEDVRRATDALPATNDVQARNELMGQVGNDFISIDQSFEVVPGEPESSVPIGGEASGEVTMKRETVYSLVIVPKSSIERYLDLRLPSEIENQSDQRIYANGVDSVIFDNFSRGDGGSAMTAFLKTSFEVGPEIDEGMILERAKGGTVGEVQMRLMSINGVRNVDVRFPHFWVRRVPDNADKITIQFEVEQ